MKTFSELQKDLQQIRNEAGKIAAREGKTTAQLKTARINNRIAFEIVKNNACIALYNEVMPIILNTLKAYEGKPHGEKTAEKIRYELKAKTNCFVYISYEEINISAKTASGFQSWDYRITVGGTYNPESGERNSLLTPDNKIKVLPIDSFMLCNIKTTYIDNVQETIKELKALRTKAYQQQQKLKEICDQYNALAVGDIERLRCDKYISKEL